MNPRVVQLCCYGYGGNKNILYKGVLLRASIKTIVYLVDEVYGYKGEILTVILLYLAPGHHMHMSRWEPPARLDPVIYSYWIEENPKTVQGGKLHLEENSKPPSYEDDVKLVAHRILTNVLDSPHADNLYIFGFPNKYKGFKIIVKNGHGYLLMAHETHLKGSFKTDDGRTFGDHPHFHQVNYDHKRREDGMPGKKYIVPPTLNPGINPAELLESFKNHYHFDDGSSDPIQMPQIKELQKELGDFP